MHRSPQSNPSSPVSSSRSSNPPIPKCFRPPPKPKPRPIDELTVRELRDIYNRNKKILSSPPVSTSAYVVRISAEQAAVEARLVELDGMETIQTGLKNTRIRGEDDMVVDTPPEPPTSRTIEAKRKALSRFASQNATSHPGSLSLREAIELEQQAHARDAERRQQALERKQRMGISPGAEFMTQQEREARIWAFMNYKPTDSDLEDEDEYDSDEDPATWFEDDQDDGRKGQDIVLPDAEDLSDIIRVDPSMIPYSTFYEPQDDDD